MNEITMVLAATMQGTTLFSTPDLLTGGERAGTRTQDLLIKSQLLCQLSYALWLLTGWRNLA